VALVGGLIVLSSLVSLVPPFLLRDLFDVALPRGDAALVTTLALGMLAITLAGSVFNVVQAYLSTTVGQQIMHDLRTAVYQHLQRMSLAFFTRTRTGEIQSRIANDIGGMQTTVTNIATVFVSSATTVTATVIAMVAFNWKLTLASLLMVPVFAWLSRRVGEERKDVTTQRQQQLALMSSTVAESLSVNGILLGRTMGRSAVLNDEFAAQSRTLTDLAVRSSMVGRWRQGTIQIILAAMPICIYWAAGLAGSQGRPLVTVGTLLAFTALQQRLLAPTVTMIQIAVTIQSSMALFDRVFEYLDLPFELAEPANPVALPTVRGHVRFEHARFSYDGTGATLTDIDLDIPAGTSLAIVGETGAGKTTLGYLVARLYDVTGGRITIDGVDVRTLSFATLAAAVGVVSQETYLFHASVADNLRFAKPDATHEELVAAAKAAQINRLIETLPEGYDTLVGERGYRFSGGEKQRLAIARTILRNPTVLVLDEATSALDSHTERSVQRAIDRLSAGRTTIVIAHRLSTIRDADQIVVLDRGRVVERGRHDELVALRGSYYSLLNRDRPPIETPGTVAAT
jgi:ATP-binding cassette subfamily B protein